MAEIGLLGEALAHTGGAFAGDDVHLGLLREGVLDFGGDTPELGRDAWGWIGQAVESGQPVATTAGDERVVIWPLVAGGATAGVLLVRRRGSDLAPHDRAMLDLLASRLTVSIENTRLYQQLDMLFRQYLPAEVASALQEDPEQAELGGAVRDVTVLFADLRGFTGYSEQAAPADVVAMLNDYFSIAVPVLTDHGGTVTAFIGDAVMALFNAPTRQDDHPVRAVRAALAIQAAIEGLAARTGGPRFRVGINSGPALVGNIGSYQRRTYTAIGDAVNVAQRLESHCEVGQILIGDPTRQAARSIAITRALGPVQVKGRLEPVFAHEVLGLRREGELGTQTVTIPTRPEPT